MCWCVYADDIFLSGDSFQRLNSFLDFHVKKVSFTEFNRIEIDLGRSYSFITFRGHRKYVNCSCVIRPKLECKMQTVKVRSITCRHHTVAYTHIIQHIVVGVSRQYDLEFCASWQQLWPGWANVIVTRSTTFAFANLAQTMLAVFFVLSRLLTAGW